jgi:hypothetical protein
MDVLQLLKVSLGGLGAAALVEDLPGLVGKAAEAGHSITSVGRVTTRMTVAIDH